MKIDHPTQRFGFHPDRTLPKHGEVWVFGSNLAGRHGKGAAKVAYQRFGAKYGTGQGYMRTHIHGQHCYAVPTKDAHLKTLPLGDIVKGVAALRTFAIDNPTLQFWMTRIGCELAAYQNEQIATLFLDFPPNMNFAEEWKPWLQL